MGVENREIVEMKIYFDGNGRQVKEFTQVFGKEKKEPLYKGTGQIGVFSTRPDGTPLPPRQEIVEFFFPAGTTLKTAFETYKEVGDREVGAIVEKMREAEAARRVVPAAGMPSILGADGKPALKLG